MANAARVTYPAALQRCKLDAPLLAAGLLTISVLCVMALLAAPIRAYAEVCTHSRVVKIVETDHYPGHRGYDTEYYRHREWVRDVEYICFSCGEEFLGDKQYRGDWEKHNWIIDLDNPDDRGYGLIVYDAYCDKCGYEDTLSNYEIENVI